LLHSNGNTRYPRAALLLLELKHTGPHFSGQQAGSTHISLTCYINHAGSMQVFPERQSGPPAVPPSSRPESLTDNIFSSSVHQIAYTNTSPQARSGRFQTARITSRGMPSPRASPAMRPTSPLSGYKSNSHFENFRPPSPRGLQPRSGSSLRPPGNLKLPPLPRFHPANFPSAYSSMQNTPDGMSPSQPPASPRSYAQRNDLRQQMYVSQREMMSAALRVSSPGQNSRPISPRLAPIGSPGPVTPLELEEEGGYLVAGVRHATNENDVPMDLVDDMIDREVRRQQPRQSTQGSASYVQRRGQ